jgi:acetylornithine deacetylase/succinyl-diaminopimelate desuccinylase-like protein
VIGDEAIEICQALLRLDTVNPPGNERPAADYLDGKLREVGYEPVILESAPSRANLVCRRPGTGKLPPLLLTAHLDVVEVEPARWTHPPFAGTIADGCLWGRGAIDMKNMAAMCVAILRGLARDGTVLDRDVIFAGVADEEAGCELGSKWLVDHHRALVESEYAIGESGGFTLHLGTGTFYPIQVAEKGFVWLRATVRGEAGHGSTPRDDSAIVRLGELLARLKPGVLPPHSTSYMRTFFAEVAARQPAFARPLLKVLTHPALMPRIAGLLPPSLGRSIQALLGNTASPTVVRGGNKVNVIPGEASVLIDGRTLPGQTTESFLAELRAVVGADVELEVMADSPPIVTEPIESPLYRTMERAILQREPDATVLPFLIPGFTDAKHFTRTGAKWYGFSPVKLDKGIRFAEMFHGHDERIPLDGLRWGTSLLDQVVREHATVPG